MRAFKDMGKGALLLVVLALLVTGTVKAQPPTVEPPFAHRYSVHYACTGSNETRDAQVDADSEEDARAVMQKLIPCIVILKITEIEAASNL